MKPLLLLTLCCLTACSFLGQDTTAPERTLADLEPARLPEQSAELPSVSLEQLSALYSDVLRISDDPDTRRKVQHRLADIEMYRGEDTLAQQPGQVSVFSTAIQAYEQLLSSHPRNANNDQLIYQLSKAYDLNGEPEKGLQALERLSREYPDSPHYAEAEFRKAESYFSAGNYPAAERAYARVIGQGSDGSYYQNALYMHGWSQFKRGHYRASIKSFTETLDRLVPADNNLDALDRGEKELASDSLRVLAVVFSYEQGVETINSVYQNLGERYYSPLLYSGLAELYLSQERYRDSAETFKAYAQRYPGSVEAHQFHYRAIKAYQQGGFPQEVIAEKESYVARYAVNGNYWFMIDDANREQLGADLKVYLAELAKHYHAQAQASVGAGDESGAIVFYAQAGVYYQAYIDSFPNDPGLAEVTFLLAESRFEAREYRLAIEAYERVAYLYSHYDKAADAGYSAITSYEKLLSGDAEVDQWIEREKIASELRFSDYFPEDERASKVVANASQSLFALAEYTQASAAAEKLTRWQPQLEDAVLLSAWLTIGHSQFELGDYLLAENAYQQALAYTRPGDKHRDKTRERLAASVYRQGEAELAAGNTLQAAEQFDRVASLAPDSSIRVNAQYDAATNYMAAGKWSKGISLLKDFQRRFPLHGMTAGIAAKLVVAYEATGNWGAAASTLGAIASSETDPEKKRQSLYLAAEYSEKSGDQQQAIIYYRDYAHTYPEPFSVAMEARYRLSELYLATDEPQKRRYWLNKMIVADRAAATERNDRSIYLAAMSSSVLADDDYQQFLTIKLSLPIKKSLKRKKSSMEKVLTAYKQTHDYGVQQFSTLATYRIGEVYGQLSRDLIDSQRPNNLDELALEQYEILLEEQAYPFEEKAIAIHETNAVRPSEGLYDDWIKESIASLAKLLPARYNKVEHDINYSSDIF